MGGQTDASRISQLEEEKRRLEQLLSSTGNKMDQLEDALRHQRSSKPREKKPVGRLLVSLTHLADHDA